MFSAILCQCRTLRHLVGLLVAVKLTLNQPTQVKIRTLKLTLTLFYSPRILKALYTTRHHDIHTSTVFSAFKCLLTTVDASENNLGLISCPSIFGMQTGGGGRARDQTTDLPISRCSTSWAIATLQSFMSVNIKLIATARGSTKVNPLNEILVLASSYSTELLVLLLVC